MSVSDPLLDAVTPDPTYCVVLRRLDAVGHESIRGEVLDTQDWPQHRIDTLIERRFIAPLPSHIEVPATTRIEGVNRAMIDLNKLAEEAPKKGATKPKPVRNISPTKAKKKKSTTKPTD
jgi:hypothetical protein